MDTTRTTDLHVVKLQYRLRRNEVVTYVEPAPITFESPVATIWLANGDLICEMKEHFITEAEAKGAVEPVLCAWEVDSDLRYGRGEFRFDFVKSEIIDRAPVTPGEIHGHLIATLGNASLTAFGTVVTIHVKRTNYPNPPGSFRLTPQAESVWTRYQGYLDGREPLLPMAYFCLTVLESDAGGRQKAATLYRIDQKVLRKIGELTSIRGNNLFARKASSGPTRELRNEEQNWLECVIKLLIWRCGETGERALLPIITMADLPPL